MVYSSRWVRLNRTVDGRTSPRCLTLKSSGLPIKPALTVVVGPTNAGLRVSTDSSLKLALSRSSGSSTR